MMIDSDWIVVGAAVGSDWDDCRNMGDLVHRSAVCGFYLYLGLLLDDYRTAGAVAHRSTDRQLEDLRVVYF